MYVPILVCVPVWLASHLYLYYHGHYPVQFYCSQIMLFVLGVALFAVAVTQPESLWVAIGAGTLIFVSTAWVPLTVSAVKQDKRTPCWTFFLALHVFAYLLLCLGFCLLNTALGACICGASTVVMANYCYSLYKSVEVDDPAAYIHI